jgi:hypothetical protein
MGDEIGPTSSERVRFPSDSEDGPLVGRFGNMARGQPRQPLDSRLFLVDPLAHQQPAEDQVMPMMEYRSEHAQPAGHWLG